MRRRRALILSAGLGTRLRPLTAALPKPLMPVAGRPLVAHTLAALVEAGCEAVALNLHYQAETIRNTLGASFQGVPLFYSEEHEILGTLGALAPLAGFFQDAEEVLVVNGDSLCPWPLEELLAEHHQTEAQATLLVSETAEPESYGGGVGLAADGRVVSLRGLAVEPPSRYRVFTGAQVLSPELLVGLEAREQDLVADLYQPLLLAGGKLRAFSTARPWHDLGTPRRYLEGVFAWLRHTLAETWISPDAQIAESAKIRTSVVEAGSHVGSQAQIEGSLILPGARVGGGATIEDSIVGFGAEVQPGEKLIHQLLQPIAGGRRSCPLE